MTDTIDSNSHPGSLRSVPRLARWVLAAFVITFFAARIVVLLIMTRRMPDLYLYAGGTHVHHLNYGIFLLVIVGAWGLFAPPRSLRRLRTMALFYGVGLGLTFDEFGMWLNLGGGYWQRASYDAVVSIAALLGLIAFAPSVRHFRPANWAVVATIIGLMGVGGWLIADHAKNWQQHLDAIEQAAPQ